MINVIVSIKVKQGNTQAYIDAFNKLAAKVRKEEGCVYYFAAKDVNTGMPMNAYDPNAVTILERWESMEALKRHLSSPNMQAQQDPAMQAVESVSMKVVEEA